MSDEEYMQLAYQQACQARDIDEVPIGAIIVKDGQIIAQAFNQKESTHDVTAHAEMIAIRKACQKLGTWHLDGCVLYSTLEPCLMCSGAIIQSRIEKVVSAAKGQSWHGLSNYLERHEFNHYPQIISGVLAKQCCLLLSQYFKSKRNH